MEHTNNQNAFGLDKIDQPVRPDDELTETRQLWIPELVAPIRVCDKRVRSFNGQLRQAARVRLGVLRDELDGRLEVLNGRIRPNYSASHFDRRFLTCSWLWTLPAAAARRPRSIF